MKRGVMQDDTRKFRQANPSAPIPRETLGSARATVETLSNVSKWQRITSFGGGGGGGHNGNRSQSTHREARVPPKSGTTGCFHCGGTGHYAKDCHKLQKRLPNLPAADFDKLPCRMPAHFACRPFTDIFLPDLPVAPSANLAAKIAADSG